MAQAVKSSYAPPGLFYALLFPRRLTPWAKFFRRSAAPMRSTCRRQRRFLLLGLGCLRRVKEKNQHEDRDHSHCRRHQEQAMEIDSSIGVLKHIAELQPHDVPDKGSGAENQQIKQTLCAG